MAARLDRTGPYSGADVISVNDIQKWLYHVLILDKIWHLKLTMVVDLFNVIVLYCILILCFFYEKQYLSINRLNYKLYIDLFYNHVH